MKYFIALLLICTLLLGLCACGQAPETSLSTSSRIPGSSTNPPASSTRPTNPTTLPATIPTTAPTTPSTPTVPAAPDFTVYNGDLEAVHLSDFVGKPVVLNFWASWCGPCKSEMPHFQAAYEEHGDDLHFLMVNMSTAFGDAQADAEALLSDNGYTFPVYYDTAMGGAFAYGVNAIPVTYFIDADGNLVAYYQGAMTAEILQQGISMIYLQKD